MEPRPIAATLTFESSAQTSWASSCAPSKTRFAEEPESRMEHVEVTSVQNTVTSEVGISIESSQVPVINSGRAKSSSRVLPLTVLTLQLNRLLVTMAGSRLGLQFVICAMATPRRYFLVSTLLEEQRGQYCC
jgi:hypothetical protein